MNNRQLSEHIYGENAPYRCPECHAVWPGNAKFCGYCGNPLTINKTQANKPVERTACKKCRCDPFVAYYKECPVHGWS